MSIIPSGMFSVDPKSTPEQLAQRKALMAMLRPKYGSARYVGEGLGQLATGIVEGLQNRKMREIEGAGRDSANDLFSGLFGKTSQSTAGGQPGPMNILGVNPAYDKNDPTQISGDTMAALGKDAGTAGYRASLIGTESGGNWKASNNEMGAGGQSGHFGRVQFGKARLQEAMDAGVIPQGTTPEQFMNSPALQIAAENWHFADLEKQLGDLVGKEVNGQVMDMGALVAMGHLGGAGGARKYVESGGAYNPSDSFGTSLSDYAMKHGGQVSMSAQDGAPMPFNSATPAIPTDQLLAAMANPWLTPEQRAILTTVYDQQVQAGDPMRALELQKAQLELDQMKAPPAPPEDYTSRMFMAQAAGLEPGTPEFQSYMLTGTLPGGGNVPAGFASLDMQAQAAGFVPGTPEYQDFMRNGGGSGTPAAFTALDMQAKAAGFEPGTPEYQEFMATRGAGLAAEAKTKGEAAAAAEIAAPADVATAERTLKYIEDIRSHPGREMGTGFSSVFNWLPGSSGKDFQNRVNQVTSGAFLTAIDEMRGMGSLSNAEGETARAAITRMDTATSEAEFLAALGDYEAVVRLGMDRAKKRIKAPEDAAPQKKTLKYNPATGEFE